MDWAPISDTVAGHCVSLSVFARPPFFLFLPYRHVDATQHSIFNSNPSHTHLSFELSYQLYHLIDSATNRTVLLIARSGDSFYGSAPITRTTLASSVHLRTNLLFDSGIMRRRRRRLSPWPWAEAARGIFADVGLCEASEVPEEAQAGRAEWAGEGRNKCSAT
ncbi:hypothetical protein K438DRAFT_1785858 [Mycena galopus ATCC 62051]|nr:hypothetical protein K438DRAFT_1785858 [Mycena galopus ATCC 62051]